MAQRGYLYVANGAWYVRYRENGKQKCHQLAKKTEYPKKAEVEPLRQEYMASVNRTHKVPGAGATVGEFVENTYWSNIDKRLDASTVAGYRKGWNKHLAHCVANMRVRDVMPMHIQQALDAIAAETKLTHTTYRWLKVCLSAIFSEAVRCGLIQLNPVRDILTPKGKKKRRKMHAYDLAEIQQHFNAFAGADPIVVEKDGEVYTATVSRKTVRALIGVAAYAGLRQGEIRGLMKEDDQGDHLDIQRSVWHTLLKDGTKTGEDDIEPGLVPVIKPLRQLLDAVQPEYGFFFVGSRGAVIDLDNLADRVMKPFLKVHGLDWHGWHAYRRGLASNLHDLDVDDITIQSILRHQDVQTTRIHYIKTVPKQAVQAMKKLERAIDVQ